MFSIEILEDRNLLTRLNISFDGPNLVRVGDDVAYAVRVANLEPTTIEMRPFASVPLDNAQWSREGQPWSFGAWFGSGPSITLQPEQSTTFEVKGRVPSDEDTFILHAEMFFSNHSALNGLSIYVLDHFSDSHTVGGMVRSFDLHQGFDIYYDAVFDTSLQTTEPVGDLNNDGFDDVNLYFINSLFLSQGERELRRYRYTLYGAERQNGFSLYAPNDAELLGTLKVSGSALVPRDAPPPFELGDLSATQFDVGDVDGDGYEDIIRTNIRAASSSGTATVLFGPDHRENIVIFGGSRAGQAGGDIKFGVTAGKLGDISGDGIDDFYVTSNYGTMHVLYGSDVGRNATGDLNADGTVDFNDFRILAENFDRETNDRALGELDGAGE